MEKTNFVVTLSYCRESLAKGAEQVKEVLENEITQQGLTEQIRMILVGCLGLDEHAPILIVNPGYIVYGNVTPQDVPEIIEGLIKNRPIGRLKLDVDMLFNRFYRVFGDVDFFGKQLRITLRNCGVIDPENLDDYLAVRGYEALAKALTEMTPQQVIEEVKQSGLRGRGGAGFLTGMKWGFTAKEQGEPKYVICNADEGDPGAFMDRSTIEGDPHTILEGMAIGGYAIGAQQGFIYIRAEYPLAIKRLEIALIDARREGFLGKNILGSNFSFDIEIRLGAGAFVCGEETALIHSVEGKRGMPRPKPPYPAAEGVFNKPTVINNVETWANIPVVILDGAKWFSSIGTETCKGTKVFALAGNINNSGLIEVPMGTTLRDIVYDVGGGIPNKKNFKAVQTGGPSGGCLPESYLDTPIDYESLTQAGSIMGSGGMIVVDENTCMVNLAKFFLEFVCDESCGKCVPCREGTRRMYQILDRITKGEGTIQDLDTLEQMGNLIKRTSLCGLGQTAPNPVLSTLRYFREEYIEHIQQKRCRAAVCPDLTGAPCQATCPLGTEAWRYIAHIHQGEYEKAYMVLREPNPIPAVLGRVCNHPCERSCRAGRGSGEAIAIRALKRFVTDRVDPSVYKPERRKNGNGEAKKVAVVGAGPGGLSVAHHLSLKGYKVTLFDIESKPGGWLRAGIPEYRLPREILDKDVQALMDDNITFKANCGLGRDITLEELKQNFNAIFLAIGAHKSLKLNIEGEQSKGIFLSAEFLKAYNLHGKNLAKGHVGVIGGGNSAVDSSRSALRQKDVKRVTVFYRRTRHEMPAFEEEIEDALAEGIRLETLIAPTRIITEKGRITEVEFIRNKLGDVDDSGRRRPVPIEGSQHIVKLDTLIVAIGERPDTAPLTHDGLEISKQGNIRVDPDTLMTNCSGVFAGGDVVTGPNTVVEAVAAGKKAAEMIDRYLNDEELKRPPQVCLPTIYIPAYTVQEDEEEVPHRAEIPKIPEISREKNFLEVEQSLSVTCAARESGRCLRCDLDFTLSKTEPQK